MRYDSTPTSSVFVCPECGARDVSVCGRAGVEALFLEHVLTAHPESRLLEGIATAARVRASRAR